MLGCLTSEADRHREQDTRIDMEGCPHEGGQNVGGIKMWGRHSQHACEQRHERTHDRGKAGKKRTPDAISVYERFAALDQLRTSIYWPAS